MPHSRSPNDAGSWARYGFTDVVEIDRGSSATVLRARQEQFDRPVAIKVLFQHLESAAARRHFERECRALGKVSTHPHVVSLYDSGLLDDSRPFMVMEFCSQGSLDKILKRRGQLAVDEVLRIGIKLCSALQAAHKADLLHRDIKPGNVLITDLGQPALADFGIAAGAELASLSVNDYLTPLHAAPEVLEHGGGSVASDIWSLGSTLYTLLLGRAPYSGAEAGLMAILGRIVHDPLPPLGRADVPRSLIEVLEGSLAKGPESRWLSATEFAVALQAVQLEQSLTVTEYLETPSDHDGSRAEARSREDNGRESRASGRLTDRSEVPQPPEAAPATRRRVVATRPATDDVTVLPRDEHDDDVDITSAENSDEDLEEQQSATVAADAQRRVGGVARKAENAAQEEERVARLESERQEHEADRRRERELEAERREAERRETERVRAEDKRRAAEKRRASRSVSRGPRSRRIVPIAAAITLVIGIAAALVVKEAGGSSRGGTGTRISGSGEALAPAGEAVVIGWTGPDESRVSNGRPLYLPTGRSLTDRSTVPIFCTVFGTETHVGRADTFVWDFTSAGFVSDVHMYTRTSQPTAPGCTGNVGHPIPGSMLPNQDVGPFPLYSSGNATSLFTSAGGPLAETLPNGTFVRLACVAQGPAVPAPRDRLGAAITSSSLWAKLDSPRSAWVPYEDIAATTISKPPAC